MFEDLLNDFANTFFQSAAERLAVRTSEAVIDSFFDSNPNSTQNNSYQNRYKGKIHKVWIEHNIKQDNYKGMIIHCKFEVENVKNIKCRAVAYLYYRNGNPLKDLNNSYYTTDGNVSTSEEFTPIYEVTIYKDFPLFIPYHELHLPEGKHELKLFIRIYDEETKTEIVRSNEHYFNHTYVDNEPRGSIDKIWVDFDIINSGQTGMNIHLQFSTCNLMGNKCGVTAFFYSEDGQYLKDQNNQYCTTSGQVCSYETFTPPYKNSSYKDFVLFMPYSELHLPRGEYNLNLKIRLYDQVNKSDITWSNQYSFLYSDELTMGEGEIIEVLESLKRLLAEIFFVNTSSFDYDTRFVDIYGANFIGSVKFIRAVENEFNVKVEYDDDTAEIHDLGDAALYIMLLKCLQRKHRLSNVSNTRVPQEPPKIESKYRRESLR
ncbi:hypothetical protein RIVM261_074150 [Rivularia sp. IAM M-261]|nr:hypothetical protein RIVM261_074150 [Rivularia sp. IAM M-261]